MRVDILNTVWERTGPGSVFIPRRHASTGTWDERAPYYTPLELTPTQEEGWDIYYTPVTYADTVRVKESLHRWGVLYADLDNAFDRTVLEAMPATLLIETSPGNYQAVWFLSEPVTAEFGAVLNRRLSHLIHADHGAWIPTKVLRIPESINYKRDGVVVQVREWDPSIEYSGAGLLWDLPPLPERVSEGGGVPPIPEIEEWRALLRKWWPYFDHKLRVSISQAQVIDRSLHLARLARAMATISVPPHEIFALLSRLPTNKFRNRPDVLWKSVVLSAYE